MPVRLEFMLFLDHMSSSSRRGFVTLFSRLARKSRKTARNNVGLARPTQQLTQHVLVPPARFAATRNSFWAPPTFTFASGPSVKKLTGRRAAEAWAARAYSNGFIKGIPAGSRGSCFTNSNGDTFGPGFLNEDGETFLWLWDSGKRKVYYHASIYYREKAKRNNGFGFHITTEPSKTSNFPKTHFYFDRHGNFIHTTRKIKGFAKIIKLEPPPKVVIIAEAMAKMLKRYRRDNVAPAQVHYNL